MNVLLLNYSDITGGAARAAYRLHRALRDSGVDSKMFVNSALAGDWSVEGPSSKSQKATVTLRHQFGNLFCKLLTTENPIIHSPQVLPSRWVKLINSSKVDIVHLHWVQGEMLSITDIGRINKPTIWTLHDMWAFCGAEHYTEDFRWRDGYQRDNRPAHESGFDLNRWTWNRKSKHWKFPVQIVTPSRWLANCVRESTLMHDWPVTVVPNPIDTERWTPIDQSLARELLGLPRDVPMLLFGAIGGGRDYRKGFDLLEEALRHLLDAPEAKGIELVVFGQLAPKDPIDFGFPIHYMGHLHDDLSLQALYSAADMLILPSRQDNLPNTGVESLACGTPVLAFDTCGLRDIVSNRDTGYLAKAFDTEDMAQGILWILKNSRSLRLHENSRSDAVQRFSFPVVAKQYIQTYQTAISDSSGG